MNSTLIASASLHAANSQSNYFGNPLNYVLSVKFDDNNFILKKSMVLPIKRG